MRTPIITSMSEEDIQLTLKVENSGTRKSKDDIIYLFKKYIDSTCNICRTCNSEIIMMWKKYLHYYEKYTSDNQVDTNKK